MCLEELSGCELIALASIIAIILSEGKTSEQIDLLGNFFFHNWTELKYNCLR